MLESYVPVRCKCGAVARYRYKIPCHWVECSSKKCPYKLHTGYFQDKSGVYDPDVKERVLLEWERLVLADGKQRRMD